MSDLSIIGIIIFVAASLAIYAAYWTLIFNRREQRIVNRRLELSKGVESPSAVLDILRRERGISNAASPLLRQINDWLTQTGLKIQGRTQVLVLLVLCLVLIVMLSMMLGFGFTSIALGLFTTIGLTAFYLNRERTRRIFAFSEQLPEAIDIIVRGVRVGLPFSSAIALVAREMPDPVGTEFGMLSDELSFGLDFRTALENLNRRVGQDDLQFLTLTASIQSQTGGDIAEILGRLSHLMRNRENMRLKIKALSAEGRATAYALSAFPFVLILVLNILSPSYFGAVRGNPILEPAIYLGLVLLAIGNVIIYRMVNFKY